MWRSRGESRASGAGPRASAKIVLADVGTGRRHPLAEARSQTPEALIATGRRTNYDETLRTLRSELRTLLPLEELDPGATVVDRHRPDSSRIGEGPQALSRLGDGRRQRRSCRDQR